MSRRVRPFAERFWLKVEKTSACWLWLGGFNGKAGYGMITLGRRGEGRVLAHRASYAMAYGPIPEDMMVLHECDNPRCVRPDHLLLGDHLDNMRDMVARGRSNNRPLFGIENGMGRLTSEKIEEIRSASGSQRQVASRFGVTYGYVGQLRRKEARTHG